jgi:DMSO/TMAO reductase YedYZ molybdopterin-dependent catalytic subunit
MATRRARLTVQIQTRREFLGRSMGAAAAAGLAACLPPRRGSREDAGGPQARDGSMPSNDANGDSLQDAGSPNQDGSEPDETRPVTSYGPITPNEHFYITSCCSNPEVDASTWALSIKDRGVEIASIDYATLTRLPARKKEHTLECISAGPDYLAISNAIWTGLPLVEVFRAVGVQVSPGTLELVFRSVDEYSTSIPLEDLQKPVWLVWLMNGVALPTEHGYPVRLLVPGRYGMKNPKWITSIDFVDQPFTGYWDRFGWSKDAVYQTNALVHVPVGDVPAGELVASGTAFAGSDPIASVEVSVDGGGWRPAIRDYGPGPDVWTLWHYDMVLEAGAHTLQVRCKTVSGNQSNPSWDDGDYLNGYGGSESVTFNAT